jgi:hypothetical protein
MRREHCRSPMQSWKGKKIRAPLMFNPRLAIRRHFPHLPFFASSLHFHFFFLSIDIGTAPQTTLSLYNVLELQTLCNSLRLTILSIFFLTITNICLLHHCSFFFLTDRVGWQRISALWYQDWTEMYLEYGLGPLDYKKNVGKPSQLFLDWLTFPL